MVFLLTVALLIGDNWKRFNSVWVRLPLLPLGRDSSAGGEAEWVAKLSFPQLRYLLEENKIKATTPSDSLL